MKSLRLRLFGLIAAATVIVWSAAAVCTTVSAHRDIERVLDRRLREAAHMVASLGSTAIIAPEPNALAETTSDYERQLSCQVWSLQGRLIGRSSSAPAQPLATGKPGFSERIINGVAWRVYTYVVPRRGLRVMVGDTLAMRRNLVTDLMTGLIVPAILGLIALAMLIWIGTGRGLAPLKRVAGAIESRDPDDLSPLGLVKVPSELTIVTTAIDTLLARLDSTRDTERQFLASAAHELQTPLAGLKTQAEIARRTDDADVRANALQKIDTSVVRTTRLVRQLLDLARQEGLAHVSASPPVPLWELLSQTQDQLAALLIRHQATLAIDYNVEGIVLTVDEEILRLALRNLIENAVIYGPIGQILRVSVDEVLDSPRLMVDDEGPGLSQNEAAPLRQRFVRGIRSIAPGSGLGLSIVDTALARIDSRLNFERREPQGTRAIITLPVNSMRRTASNDILSNLDQSE